MTTEPTNTERAEWAGAAMAEYLSMKGEPHNYPARQEEISDLICDLLHHGTQLGFAHERLIERALMHFDCETEEKE